MEEHRTIIVIGAGELGLQVAERLQAHKEKVVIIDEDISRIARARQYGFEAIAGSAEQFDPQVAPYFDRAQSLICTNTDSDFNFRVCQFARTHYGIAHLIAQVSTPSELPRFERLGVTTANAALDRAGLLVLLARNPAFYDLLTRTDDNKEVLEIVVENTSYVGKKLRQLSLPGDVLILSIRRNGEFLVPHGNTQLELFDHLTLVGTLEHVDRARYMFVDGLDG
ncbi:MAG: TrkA family potassium uptake protein [Chloroflexi bacterium]|nr:TrkA family potassium uptake protein [Chloroflexota bacterium]